MSLRLVMMGTGNFALPTFLSLYDSEHEVVGLFTQPDRTGRGHHHHVNPLKAAALEHGTPLFQPQNVNLPSALTDLRELNPDLCIVAAYGQILSQELLEIPQHGAINVHASLLPKYRGAAPIQYAILNGETETGVTIFQIEPKLDAGPILAVGKTEIGPKETSGQLEARLAEISIELVDEVVKGIAAGTLEQITQNQAEVTRAPRIRKSLGMIEWRKSAAEIGCLVRAMQPWPKAYTFLAQSDSPKLRLILLDVEPIQSPITEAEPGTLVETEEDRMVIATGCGLLEVLRLLPEGKWEMTAEEFARGHSLGPETRFVANS